MLKKFFRDRRGNITIMSVVMITSLVGMAGLVADYGSGLFVKMQDQRVADAAAMAGATIYSATNSSSAASTAVTNVASLNGVPSTSIASSVVTSPTGDGNQAVEVTVSSSSPLSFSQVLQPGTSNLSIQAVAYAEIAPGGLPCVMALGTGGTGITTSGGTSLTASNCKVASNQTITCLSNTTITTNYAYYNSAAPSCPNLKTASGGTPHEKQMQSADPLKETAAVMTPTGRLSTVEGLTSPSGPGSVSGTPANLAFSSSNNLTITTALTAQGCVGVYVSSWTVTCPLGGTYKFGTISVSGGATVNFNTGLTLSTTTYDFTEVATGSGTLNFGPGIYNVTQGIVTTNGSAVTTFGAGSFNIGASSSLSCNSSNTYSICNTGPTMTFAGPSTFVLHGGIYAKGSTTVTLGSSGSTNSFNIGKAADGNSLYMGGGAKVWFGDATGTGDLFQMAGNVDVPSGGTCLNIGAAANHDINGYYTTSGGNILGSGVYTISDYLSLGGSGGGDVTCWGTDTGVNASGVTIVLGGQTLDSSGNAFYVGAGYAKVTIAAPTSGTTANVAIIGPTSSSNTGSATFTEGSTNTAISGAFYFPNGAISMSGAASVGSSGCLELLGSQVTLSAGSTLATACNITGQGTVGSSPVALVQ